MVTQEYIKTLNCGIRGATFKQCISVYPELTQVLCELPDDVNKYYFDMKVHMLMPGQYPCIPNWHRDFVPRDENKIPHLDKIRTEFPLFLWLSGQPLTEFKDGRKIMPQTWIKFTQDDVHRGTVSKEHCWRLFIRASRKEITPPHNINMGLVRHSQVYLDAQEFTW